MAGIFDFDKTILAALETKDRRQMYEKERADRNMQWEKSFGLQQEQLNTSKYQFDEGHKQRLEEVSMQIEANKEQEKLRQEFTTKENNFSYLQGFEEDRGQYGKLSGTSGSALETQTGRDLGDLNFENKKWISKNAIDDYRHNQAMALEREQLGLAKWTANKLYGEDENRAPIPYQKLSGISPITNSEYLEKLRSMDIKDSGYTPTLKKWFGDDFGGSMAKMLGEPEAETDFKKVKNIIDTEVKTAEDLIVSTKKDLNKVKTLSPDEKLGLLVGINNLKLKYFSAPITGYTQNEKGETTGNTYAEGWNPGETYLSKLVTMGKSSGAISEDNIEYEKKLNKLSTLLGELEVSAQGLRVSQEKGKNEQLFEK